jgi:hypothetical protein
MGRAPCCEKMGLKRGPWTAEEDKILVAHITSFGHGNWRALPKQAGECPPFSDRSITWPWRGRRPDAN